MSNTAQVSCELTSKSDGLYFNGTYLQYRITGLTTFNLDRLKVTLKAMLPDTTLFHVDTIDLYNSKARESFADGCHKYLKTKTENTTPELMQLITSLEAERVTLAEKPAEEEAVPKMSNEEVKEAMKILKESTLVNRIIEDYTAIGLIGEKHNKLLGYLSAVSRLLPDPLGVLILSRSGAGKTSLQDAVCKFVPPESRIQYTRLTGQSLFYRDENALKNKVLAIEEEEGMQDAMYSIRTLQSSQKLSIATTKTDSKTGKLSVDEYTVYGPVVIMISTTNPDALDPETRQRFLVLTIDESVEQTRKILQIQRQRITMTGSKYSMDESSVTKLHHNMQRLLKPLTPIFPDDMVIEYPYKRLQMRREQRKYLSLIKAITLLHQHQRKTGTITRLDKTTFDYVLVDKRDVKLAKELGSQVFHRNIDDVSPTGRTLIKHIAELVSEKTLSTPPGETPDYGNTPFTRKELREKIGWSEAQVRQNIEPLVELGYLAVLGGRQGTSFRYVMIDDGLKDPKLEL